METAIFVIFDRTFTLSRQWAVVLAITYSPHENPKCFDSMKVVLQSREMNDILGICFLTLPACLKEEKDHFTKVASNWDQTLLINRIHDPIVAASFICSAGYYFHIQTTDIASMSFNVCFDNCISREIAFEKNFQGKNEVEERLLISVNQNRSLKHESHYDLWALTAGGLR